MNKLVIPAAAVSFLAAAGLGFAGAASASTVKSAGGHSAADTIASLEAEGHHVQLNGRSNVPLSQCQVSGVHGLNNSNIDSDGARIDTDLYSTVYVDISCKADS